MDFQQLRRVRYQNGTLERKSRKTGPDIWTYRWVERGAGIRRRVILGTVKELRTMQAVQQAADSYRLRANRETDVPQVTMAGVLDRYERECVAPFVDVPIGGIIQRKPSVQCARTYLSFIRKWLRPRWSSYLITDFLRPQVASEVEEWLASLWVSPTNPGGLAPKTVRGIWSLLGRIFHRARKWGYLDRNPIEMVDLPAGSTKRRAKPRSLTPAQYVALLRLYGPLERAAIAISGWLGTRRSEAFGLQWQDFDFEARVVRFERGIVHGRITPLKNEASRSSVSVPEEVREVLVEWRAVTPYRAPTDWVFASPATRGQRPYWPGQLLKTRIKPIAAAAGFGNIGWHTFRRSFSSWGKEALKLEETKELLRHENLSTTSELYGGLSLEAKRQASERLVQYVKQAAQAESMELEGLMPVSESLQ